jgi:hypothetical protein
MQEQQHKLSLTEADIALVRRCLLVSLDGRYFPDWEFHTLMGATKGEVQAAAYAWPKLRDEDTYIVHNVLVNFLGYPHGESIVSDQALSTTEERIRALLDKLINLRNKQAR